MSGLKVEVDQIFLALVESQNIRVVEYPDTVAGVNLISDGAALAGAWMVAANYVQFTALAAIANPCWILGICLGIPQVEAFYGDISIATGAALAEVDIAVLPCGTNTFAVVEWRQPVIWLPFPIKVVGAPRLSCNIRKDTGISAAGFNNCKIIAAVAVGS